MTVNLILQYPIIFKRFPPLASNVTLTMESRTSKLKAYIILGVVCEDLIFTNAGNALVGIAMFRSSMSKK